MERHENEENNTTVVDNTTVFEANISIGTLLLTVVSVFVIIKAIKRIKSPEGEL